MNTQPRLFPLIGSMFCSGSGDESVGCLLRWRFSVSVRVSQFVSLSRSAVPTLESVSISHSRPDFSNRLLSR